jgi:isoleucyl-tRNA synthetase
MYRLVKTPKGELIINQELIPSVMEACGIAPEEYQTTGGAWPGTELEGIVCRHPWIDRDSKIILGDFVTQDQGTGSVHIAPGHGQEDYEVGLRYGLPVVAPVDAEGKFTDEAGDLKGESVFKADPHIIQKLTEHGALLKEEKLSHSYPHCWRCKNPVIFRDGDEGVTAKRARRDRISALDSALGQRSHSRDARKPAGLVYFAPAFLGRADSSGLLPKVQPSGFNPRTL